MHIATDREKILNKGITLFYGQHNCRVNYNYINIYQLDKFVITNWLFIYIILPIQRSRVDHRSAYLLIICVAL